MSATATSEITAERKSEPRFDREWLDGALARWKVAAEYVFFLDRELLPTEHPLRRVIGEDLPEVLRELARFRPDVL
jgi:hypothetical protein